MAPPEREIGPPMDSWFSVVDGASQESLRNQLRHLSLSGSLVLAAAFCFWNGSPTSFPPKHLVLQQIATLAEGGGQEPATVPAVDRALRTFLRAYSFGDRTRAHDSTYYRSPVDERLPEGPTMRAAARLITNPGAPGQMLLYALHKFAPLSTQVQQALGFGPREACTTIRLILEELKVRTAPYFAPGRAPYERRRGSRRNATGLETPPRAFLRDWTTASTYPKVGSPSPGVAPLNHGVIEYLSGDPTSFALPGPSFGRWAFVKSGPVERVLLIPSMLAETLVSALHMGLFDSLSSEQQGTVGRVLGDQFESLVGQQFRRVFPAERVLQRVRRTPRAPEADFLVGLSSGEQIVVQCRGRALRQRGRWGDPELFFGDIETNIVEAAGQARRYLADNLSGPRTVSVFIVLDAYIPLTPFYTGSRGRVGIGVRDLPLPCVLSYYDLEYLLGVVDEQSLIQYLEWRGTLLTNQALIVHDEFDAIRAFLRLHEALPAEGMVDRRHSVFYTGYDPRFEEEQFATLDAELGLHLAHPEQTRDNPSQV